MDKFIVVSLSQDFVWTFLQHAHLNCKTQPNFFLHTHRITAKTKMPQHETDSLNVIGLVNFHVCKMGEKRAEHGQSGGHDSQHVRPADGARPGVVDVRTEAVVLHERRVEAQRVDQQSSDLNQC